MKVIFIYFVSVILPFSLQACDCIMYPLECYVDTTKFIFVGNVTRMDSTSISMELTEVYKGKGYFEKTALFKNQRKSNCDFMFEEDTQYVIFAHREEDGFFVVNTCSYSGLYSKSTCKSIKSAIRNLKNGKSVCKKRKGIGAFFRRIFRKIFVIFFFLL